MGQSGTGTLFVVGTPIGNLADISFRAVETLKQVALIAAEDTRRTRILLNHYGIRTPLTSYNSYNRKTRGRELVRRLEAGDNLALVSDAGTPGISDPLIHLVNEALAVEAPVVSIPGASALISAVVVSGIPARRILFEGFLPRKKGRKKTLEYLAAQPCCVVLFESPNRIMKTLRDIREVFGNRRAAIARELTKLHEEVLRGTLDDLLADQGERNWKGEITLVVAGQDSMKGE